MTKNEFIKQLMDCLFALSNEQKKEIQSDFMDHFHEGGQKGLSEDEICKGLGEPGVLADALLEVYAEPNKQNEKNNGSNDDKNDWVLQMPNINIPDISIDMKDMDDVMQKNIDYAQNQMDYAQKKMSGSAEKISARYMGSDFCKIEINEKFSLVNDIRIDLMNCRLTIKENPQQEHIYVGINGEARHNNFYAVNDNGVLVIKEDSGFGILDWLFAKRVTVETTVCLPVRFNGQIIARVGGETEIKGVSGMLLDLKNNRKKAAIKNCMFKGYDVSASAGSLAFTGSSGEYIKLHSSAGSVHTEDTEGNLDVSSSAGSVTVRRHKGEALRVKSSAGGVHVHDSCGAIKANSSAGSVNINCSGYMLNGVEVKSSGGGVSISAEEINGLEAKSSGGGVNIRAEIINGLEAKSSAGSTHVAARKLIGNSNIKSSAGHASLEAYEIIGETEIKASSGSVKLKLPPDIDCKIETKTKSGHSSAKVKGNPLSENLLRASASSGSVIIENIY